MQQMTSFESEADKLIGECCDLEKPKSFFLFAGAGSGKTRSLINALEGIRQKYGHYLRSRRKQIAVITYTNAACEEIQHRLGYDACFAVSTIHSFAWSLISNFQSDIKAWVHEATIRDIRRIKEEMVKGRSGTQAAIDRENRLIRKQKRLNSFDQIKEFTYSPTGDNTTKDSLNHTEVIQMTASFVSKPLMQQIITQRFPILFIDESQDTNKELIDALFDLQIKNKKHFILGLFGDTMQRIYNDGKPNIDKALPPDWVKPVKSINYRSPNRVIDLINKVRASVDDKAQKPKDHQIDGHVRIFVASSNHKDKITIESMVAEKMQQITGDENWTATDSKVKVLILEHHMAARRMGFLNLFVALSEVEAMRNGMIEGRLAGLNFFTRIVLPLINAAKENDSFKIAHVVKRYSDFFNLKKVGKNEDRLKALSDADKATKSLVNLWKENTPTLKQIVENVGLSGLFPLPDTLDIISKRGQNTESLPAEDNRDDDDDEKTPATKAWETALKCSFSEIERYDEYISDNPRFGTHQGVKGLEFDRVMVIIDDDEARGFTFSYNDLFIERARSTARKQKKDDEESRDDRTRRLFYVACSRARKSLAIVAYSNDPSLLRQSLLQKQWFTSEEVVMF